MLVNLYLTVFEPIDGSQSKIQMDAVPTAIQLTPKTSPYQYSQVNSNPIYKTYLGIVGQYNSDTAEFIVLIPKMRDRHISISFLKECSPVIG